MSKCRSCGAEVVWAVMDSGKRMPFDALRDPENGTHHLERENGRVVAARPKHGGDHVSHFATCPDAKKWRKP